MQRHVCLSHTQLSIKTVGKKPILNRAHYIFNSCAHWMRLPATSWWFHSPDFHVTTQTTFTLEVFKEHFFSLSVNPIDYFHRNIKIGNYL